MANNEPFIVDVLKVSDAPIHTGAWNLANGLFTKPINVDKSFQFSTSMIESIYRIEVIKDKTIYSITLTNNGVLTVFSLTNVFDYLCWYQLQSTKKPFQLSEIESPLKNANFNAVLKAFLYIFLIFFGLVSIFNHKSSSDAVSNNNETAQMPPSVVIVEKIKTSDGLLLIKKPSIACNILNTQGLRTGTWKVYDGGESNEFGCNSDYKEIGTGFPLANNLAYYVDGVSDSVTAVKLVLNVNNTDEEKTAKSELLKASEKLARKITNQKLPSSINTAILKGINADIKLAKTTIVVARSDWPTGKGYDLEVRFK